MNSQNASIIRFSITAIAIAALTACGGGGDSDATNPNPGAPTEPTAAFAEIPLVTSTLSDTYLPDTFEKKAVDYINDIRTQCGFGKVAQNTKLDQSATGHAKYIAAHLPVWTTHNQNDKTSTWYTGETPDIRMVNAGYKGAYTSEGLVAGGASFNEINLAKLGIDGLLSAPFHAVNLLSPRQEIGFGIQWPEKFGSSNNREYFGFVANYGTPTNSMGRPVLQQFPSNEVLSYPCNGTTGIFPMFLGEDPNPLPGRDLSVFPVGHPIMFAARKGSVMNLNVTMTNASNGQVIKLMAPRYSTNEIYPGTNQKFATAAIMEWAFIFPDAPLEYGTTYQVKINGTLSGVAFPEKAFSFSTRPAFSAPAPVKWK
jgi:uncharacterized protein YkwD